MRDLSNSVTSVSDFDRLLVLIPGLREVIDFPSQIALPNNDNYWQFYSDSNADRIGLDPQTSPEFADCVCEKILHCGEKVAILIDSVGLDPTGLYKLIEKLERGAAGIRQFPESELEMLMVTIRRAAARHGNYRKCESEITSDSPSVQPKKAQNKHTRKRPGRRPAPKEVAAAEEKLRLDWEGRFGRTSFEEFANQRGLDVNNVRRMINSARKRRKTAKSEE